MMKMLRCGCFFVFLLSSVGIAFADSGSIMRKQKDASVLVPAKELPDEIRYNETGSQKERPDNKLPRRKRTGY